MQDDGLSIEDMDKLLTRFRKQPLDFYGALRATTYDNQIREWIETDVIGEQWGPDSHETNSSRMRCLIGYTCW